jgi:dolichyl-phosphate-mannose--protein O-mannosyl transferase
MYFSGGVAIAFLISSSFQLLPRASIKRSRVVLLELLLIGSLTATATVFWEFAEFSVDQLLGTNIQLGLANTIKDMAMGILGSILIVLIRVWQLRIGRSELKEIAFDWIHGEAAK